MGVMSGLANALSKGEDLFNSFYRGNDKAVMNVNGKPKTYYHGTDQNFDTFDLDPKGVPRMKTSGKGFYMTSDPGLASDFAAMREGGNVMPVHAKVENAFQWPNRETASYDELAKYNRFTPVDDKLIADLRAKGHDAIQGFRYPSELIVFEPNQIKSVFNKAPTSNKNIMKGVVPGGLAAEQARKKWMDEDKPLEDMMLGF